MKCELSSICTYRKGKTKVAELNPTTYISTENMLPNKGGIIASSGLPNSLTTQEFQTGDVLVSNIRPYFKKIWLAEYCGGCSNDVLVFTANKEIDPTFLYYVLADDTFFSYATATAKGTKMPRGDRTAIMQYLVPQYDLPTQKKIGAILRSLDDKIELNNKINENLERQVYALFESWFMSFDKNEEIVPNDWYRGTLGEIASITSGKRPPMKQSFSTAEIKIPLVGASSVMGYTNAVLYNEPILVTGRVGTHGIVQRFRTPCWASDNTLVIKSDFYEYTYQVLLRVDYTNMNRGSTQPLITQTDLKNAPIVVPPKSVMLKFEQIAGTLMAKHQANHEENKRLSGLRDTLLPKLMSGEIDVEDVKI